MSIDPKAGTPGDGNQPANARGRIYWMDPSKPSGDGGADEEPIMVASGKDFVFGLLMGLVYVEDPSKIETMEKVQPPGDRVRIEIVIDPKDPKEKK